MAVSGDLTVDLPKLPQYTFGCDIPTFKVAEHSFVGKSAVTCVFQIRQINMVAKMQWYTKDDF